MVLAAKGGVDVDRARRELPRVGEVPFDPAVKLMVTAHGEAGRRWAVAKGAPDVLLGRCDLDDEATRRIVAATGRLADEGLRVLAVAEVALGPEVDVADPDALLAATRGAELLGIVGLSDPARPEARDAVEACRGAGISFTMITGDHPATARAIAAQVGIDVRGDDSVITGHELDGLTDDELTERIGAVGVVARVSPEHKVRVVRALRRRGNVVAMTGDGVNDAPALRAADIGVAMGVTGTAVAKDAADLVLTDDHIGTIVEAVRRGRALYRNIVTFVRFQLSTNIGALLTIIGAELVRLPVPFTAAQLLWVNLVMDGPPALALAADPPTGDELERPPRDPDEQILSLRRLVPLVGVALVMAAGTLGILASTHDGSSEVLNGRSATLAFTTFVLFQVANALVARRTRALDPHPRHAAQRQALGSPGRRRHVAGPGRPDRRRPRAVRHHQPQRQRLGPRCRHGAVPHRGHRAGRGPAGPAPPGGLAGRRGRHGPGRGRRAHPPCRRGRHRGRGAARGRRGDAGAPGPGAPRDRGGPGGAGHRVRLGRAMAATGARTGDPGRPGRRVTAARGPRGDA